MTLIQMKKSRKKPCAGDVFVLQTSQNIFYYGKVILANIESPDRFVKGVSLIFIYDLETNVKKLPLDLSAQRLLIAPIVVNNQPWQRGYFETLGNVGISDWDLCVDYGFWDVVKEEYVDIQKNKMSRIPKYHSIFGLGSYGIVDKEVQKALSQKRNDVFMLGSRVYSDLIE